MIKFVSKQSDELMMSPGELNQSKKSFTSVLFEIALFIKKEASDSS